MNGETKARARRAGGRVRQVLPPLRPVGVSRDQRCADIAAGGEMLARASAGCPAFSSASASAQCERRKIVLPAGIARVGIGQTLGDRQPAAMESECAGRIALGDRNVTAARFRKALRCSVLRRRAGSHLISWRRRDGRTAGRCRGRARSSWRIPSAAARISARPSDSRKPAPISRGIRPASCCRWSANAASAS
jgi:hypothetical protein